MLKKRSLISNFVQVKPPNQDSVDPEVIIQEDNLDLDLEEFEQNVSNSVGTKKLEVVMLLRQSCSS